MTDVEYVSDLRSRLPKYIEALDNDVQTITVSCNECDETWEYDPDEHTTVTMLGARADAYLQQHADETGHNDADVTLVQPIRERVFVDTTVSIEDEEPE